MNRHAGMKLAVSFILASVAVLVMTPLTRDDANASPTSTTTTVVPASCPRTVSEGGLTLPPKPTGVIAFDIYSKGQGDVPFPLQVVDDPSISGLDLAIDWDQLEPDVATSPPGTATPIEWTVLDCLFSEADIYGKFVVLTIIPGFNTPSWALFKVQTQLFSFKYHEPPYPPKALLPLPWDHLYLQRWFTFMQSVANRYENNPEFRMVATDGPTSVSGEMTLPFGTGDPAFKHLVLSLGDYHFKIDGSDVAMWQALGYSPDRLETAWTETFNKFAQIFHNRYISLALIGGLPIGNPPKRTGTSIVQPSPLDPSQNTATPLTLIAEGRTHSPQFVLQENGLSAANWPAPDRDTVFNFVSANCASIPTGFQTKDPKYEGSLQYLIAKAVASGVGFLELYQSEVMMAPPAELAAAAADLNNAANCHPLTLRAVHTGSLVSPVSVTATTTLDLASGDRINIIEAGRTIKTCVTSTCQITTALADSTQVFSANVSYADQPPLVTVSATTS